jgi:hypothetical protein
MSGNPARFSGGLKWRLTMFWASSGVPLPVANTSPLSRRLAPALSLLFLCLPLAMASEGFYGPLGQVYGAPASVPRLAEREPAAFPHPLQLTVYAKGSGFKSCGFLYDFVTS